MALNPAVASIVDRSERGRVLNEAWTRFQAAGTLAMGLTVAMWRVGGLKDAESDLDPPGRLQEHPARRGSRHERCVGDSG